MLDRKSHRNERRANNEGMRCASRERACTALSNRRARCCGCMAMSTSGESHGGGQGEPRYTVAQREVRSEFKCNGRLLAIGDVHGDADATRTALQIAGVAQFDQDGSVHWTGGDAHVVQLGDIFDRGGAELESLFILLELRRQAENCGGAVHLLLGNHELLNASGDFRYVTDSAFDASLAYAGGPWGGDEWTEKLRARIRLFSPGGEMAQHMSTFRVALKVNDTIFAHGGFTSDHADVGLQAMNEAATAWLLDDVKLMDAPKRSEIGSALQLAAGGPEAVVWNRTYGSFANATPVDRLRMCTRLQKSLAKVGANRLVIGHTPQPSGCSPACGSRVWRIDVGMSRGILGNPPQVLEIHQDGSTSVLTTSAPASLASSNGLNGGDSDSSPMRSRKSGGMGRMLW